MKQAPCVLVAMLLASQGAFAAEDFARASLKNISIALIDLAPHDGSTPTFGFAGPCGEGSPLLMCIGPRWITEGAGGLLSDPPVSGPTLPLPTYQSSSTHHKVFASPDEITVFASWSRTTTDYRATFEIEYFRTYEEYYTGPEGDGYNTYFEPAVSLSPYTRMVLAGDVALDVSDSCADSTLRSCYARAVASLGSDQGGSRLFRSSTAAGDPESLRERFELVLESGAEPLHLELTIGLAADGAHPLTPVPEPQQWALMLGGLLATLSSRRVRQALRRPETAPR